MQKKILSFVVFVTLTGIAVQAQNKKNYPPAPPPPPSISFENVAVPPPPPPPPPLPPVEPPAPPLPPEPPAAPVIINDNGYEITIGRTKETEMVFLEKDGKTQKIRLSTWNANRKFYEKRFGKLPPPPPPALQKRNLV